MSDPFLMDLWRDTCGLPPKHLLRDHPTLESLKATEWSMEFEKEVRATTARYSAYPCNERFLQYMRNRMVMGSFRYGLLKNAQFTNYDCSGQYWKKLEAFNKTYEVEYLVDAANMRLLLWIREPKFRHIWLACRCMENFSYHYTGDMEAADDKNHTKEIIK